MAINVIMPKLGLTMKEGTVTGWLKKEGEDVKEGEALLVIQTDKVSIEIPSPASGRLIRILVPENTTVLVNEVIAVLE